MKRRDKLIRNYFMEGLTCFEICAKLAMLNGIAVSESTVKRTTKNLNLFRRKNKSNIINIALFVLEESERFGGLPGYRWLHRKCLREGFTVTQEEVRLLLHIIDSQGIEIRRRKRLRRRKYFSEGSNFVWHIDGYDKLKRFGICIHGCLDGYSRYAVWLRAWNTNNDPRVIARFYLDAVKDKRGCPMKIRADRGTENHYVEQLQIFLRRNHNDNFASEKSFLYGSSVNNQRIERFWGILRKECIQHWIDTFIILKDELDAFSGDFLDKNLVRYTFIKIIQNQLDDVANIWNVHNIQAGKSEVNAKGKPTVLYNVPEMYGKRNCICTVSRTDFDTCEDEVPILHCTACDETVQDLCDLLMIENYWTLPNNAEEGIELYLNLRRSIQNLF